MWFGTEEGLLGATSDDDLPDFLLPDDSSKTRKLPGYLRSGSAPKIFKSSLKDYHGLEGVWNNISIKLNYSTRFIFKKFNFNWFQVDLNLLSSQDQEVHPITPTSRGKKSITESIAVASGQLSEAETLGSSHSSSAVQASSLVYKNKNLLWSF